MDISIRKRKQLPFIDERSLSYLMPIRTYSVLANNRIKEILKNWPGEIRAFRQNLDIILSDPLCDQSQPID